MTWEEIERAGRVAAWWLACGVVLVFLALPASLPGEWAPACFLAAGGTCILVWCALVVRFVNRITRR